MLVRDLFTSGAAFVRPDTNLAAATALLWERDCGILPVVDDANRVIGVVTDRDICMAVGTRNRLASDIAVREVCAGVAHTCRAGDTVSSALRTMRQNGVRRLPVLEDDGALAGMLSINDIVLAAKESRGKPVDLNYEEVMLALKAICAHPSKFKQEVPARP